MPGLGIVGLHCTGKNLPTSAFIKHVGQDLLVFADISQFTLRKRKDFTFLTRHSAKIELNTDGAFHVNCWPGIRILILWSEQSCTQELLEDSLEVLNTHNIAIVDALNQTQ